MTPVFTARRAEEFHRLVEGDRAGAPATRLADRLAVVDLLRAVPEPEPRAEFTADLRERLLAAADTLLVPSETSSRLTLPPRRTARDRRIAAAVGGIAVIGATSSLAVAAQSALPGDMLYPLKRAIEGAETQIQASEAARGESLLGHAADRLDEVRALSQDGDASDTPYVEQALVDFADQATLASDLVLAHYEETGEEQGVQDLRDFTADSMDTLTSLESVLPPEAEDELAYAAQVLEEVDRLAARVCPSCSGGIDEVPAVLLSAGATTLQNVVVAPHTLLPRTTVPRENQGRRSGGRKGDNGSGGSDDGSGSAGGTGFPSVDDVTGPVTSGGGQGGTGGATGPLDDVTDGLTGTGGQLATSGGNLPGVPKVDDTVKDVKGTVGGTVKGTEGTVKGVEDAVKGVVDEVDDGLGGVTGGLTGGLK